jgi:ELWxxDGT repeat protein
VTFLRAVALLGAAALAQCADAQQVVVQRMADVCPGGCDGFRAEAGEYAVGATRVYFVGKSSSDDNLDRPWVSDGTPAGTIPLAQIPTDGYGVGIQSMVTVGDVLYFTARTAAIGDWADGRRLWRSNGTPAGTSPVDFPIAAPKLLQPLDSFNLIYATTRGVVYPTYGSGIWWVPADGATPRKLVDGFLIGSKVVESGGAILFLATSCYASCPPETLASVYRFDGAGAVVTVGTFAPGISSGLGQPYATVAAAPSGFFLQRDIQELWYCDGATAPRLVNRWTPPASISIYSPALPAKSMFLFTVTTGPYSTNLWTSDGSAQGTGPVTFFQSTPYGQGPSVFGNAGGVPLILIPPSIPASAYPDAPAYPLYSELGVLDPGALLGVRTIRSLSPPGDRASPGNAVEVNGRLMFNARGQMGSDISTADFFYWFSDGTAGGTQRLDNAVFGGVYLQKPIGAVNGAVYFQGFMTGTGYELYRMTFADGYPGSYSTADVTEYYHAGFDHYFITADAAEKSKLDSGATTGWKRTGFGFVAYAPGSGAPRVSPVCRFYGRPEAGLDSHFYSASPQECADVVARFSNAWIYEAADVFEVELPDASGRCGSFQLSPLYRAYNRRADVNHRYSVHSVDQKVMQDKGWQPEGATSAGVTMCVLATTRP